MLPQLVEGLAPWEPLVAAVCSHLSPYFACIDRLMMFLRWNHCTSLNHAENVVVQEQYM